MTLPFHDFRSFVVDDSLEGWVALYCFDPLKQNTAWCIPGGLTCRQQQMPILIVAEGEGYFQEEHWVGKGVQVPTKMSQAERGVTWNPLLPWWRRPSLLKGGKERAPDDHHCLEI